ncbi:MULTISPECIES: methyltransferase domain-containing protein [unclassified Methylobacterium]|uniref:methyltransferase domain-containing protein n=1 Tax=unclassified Methylobacterium TaxID=2615210 RepID=UPI001FCDC606|nr:MULTISPECIES: methyltransferase domain-containing protein [unclassified Methylobacterium]USU34064.1 methyltransferase domain-containing protein [Methylobacterium sp. OTU13CASTA1]
MARAFDGAEGYDAAAGIQARVAEGLAARIAALPLAPAPRVLEVGCGTGLLTAALHRRIVPGPYLATDIAPAMALRCRARLGPGPGFVVMDGERPCLTPGFDLVCSSLAAQWFEDLSGSLARLAGLLAPGGHLAVATLASGTFAEWRRAHADLDFEAATPAYPTVAALAALRIPGCTVAVSDEPVVEAHADGRAFLAALRAIGAGTPEGRPPLTPGGLRRVLRRFDAGGARVTYAVATLTIRRI